MVAPRFSIIIVNFNGGHFIQGALDSLKAQSCRDFEVIVLDNASSDGSISNLNTDDLPHFKLIAEDENHGFARGNNLAAKSARGEWLVLLNPDAAAEADWLAEIDAAIARHPATNVFASCQLSLEDPGRIDGVGDNYLAYGFPWRGGFGWLASAIPSTGHVFGPCGASAVYRKDVFDRLGGFDERLFCYCEDVDLAFRLTLSGERCIFLPKAVVRHAGSAIAGKSSDFTLFHGYRNAVWVYFKNMPALFLLATLPIHLMLSAYLLTRWSMQGRGMTTANAMWRGYRQALEFRQSGASLRSSRRIQLGELASRLSWNPWAMSQHRPAVTSLGE